MGAVNSRQRGSAMVETALVLVTALTVLIGIADVGQMLFVRTSVMERVRSGLRYGAVNYDETEIRNIVLYGTSSPAENATPGFNLTSSMVSVERLGANTTADRVKITVSNYPITFYAPFLGRTLTGPDVIVVQSIEEPADP